MATASALFAVLVGTAGSALRRARGLPVPRGELTRDWTLRAGRRVQLRRVARYAIGVLLAGTGIAMVAITPLALLAVHLASPTPTAVLLVDRLVESVVGALVGIVVGFATRGWGRAAGAPGAVGRL